MTRCQWLTQIPSTLYVCDIFSGCELKSPSIALATISSSTWGTHGEREGGRKGGREGEAEGGREGEAEVSSARRGERSKQRERGIYLSNANNKRSTTRTPTPTEHANAPARRAAASHVVPHSEGSLLQTASTPSFAPLPAVAAARRAAAGAGTGPQRRRRTRTHALAASTFCTFG